MLHTTVLYLQNLPGPWSSVPKGEARGRGKSLTEIKTHLLKRRPTRASSPFCNNNNIYIKYHSTGSINNYNYYYCHVLMIIIQQYVTIIN
jgi:hypothetical protein